MCCLEEVYNVCYCDLFSVVYVYLDHLKLCVACGSNASYIDMALYLYTEPLIMARMWAGVINTIKYTEADECKL